MAFGRKLLMSEKVSDVQVDLVSETVEISGTEYNAYEVIILGYDEHYGSFSDEIDVFHFSFKKDAYEHFNKIVGEGKKHEIGE